MYSFGLSFQITLRDGDKDDVRLTSESLVDGVEVKLEVRAEWRTSEYSSGEGAHFWW